MHKAHLTNPWPRHTKDQRNCCKCLTPYHAGRMQRRAGVIGVGGGQSKAPQVSHFAAFYTYMELKDAVARFYMYSVLTCLLTMWPARASLLPVFRLQFLDKQRSHIRFHFRRNTHWWVCCLFAMVAEKKCSKTAAWQSAESGAASNGCRGNLWMCAYVWASSAGESRLCTVPPWTSINMIINSYHSIMLGCCESSSMSMCVCVYLIVWCL